MFSFPFFACCWIRRSVVGPDIVDRLLMHTHTQKYLDGKSPDFTVLLSSGADPHFLYNVQALVELKKPHQGFPSEKDFSQFYEYLQLILRRCPARPSVVGCLSDTKRIVLIRATRTGERTEEVISFFQTPPWSFLPGDGGDTRPLALSALHYLFLDHMRSCKVEVPQGQLIKGGQITRRGNRVFRASFLDGPNCYDCVVKEFSRNPLTLANEIKVFKSIRPECTCLPHLLSQTDNSLIIHPFGERLKHWTPQLAVEAIEALRTLHNLGFAHGDIRPAISSHAMVTFS